MRLRKGQVRYRIPRCHKVMDIYVLAAGMYYSLQQMAPDEPWPRRHVDGIPTTFRVFPVGPEDYRVIEIYPAPDKAYRMEVRYLEIKTA